MGEALKVSNGTSGRLVRKVTVVTGGGSGFGEAMATRFAGEGARVVVADIDVERGEAVAAAIRQSGGDAIAAVADVADRRSFENLATLTVRTYGGIDVFVNNAGVSQRFVALDEVREDEFDRLFAVNVKSLYWCGRSVVPLLRQRGGGVILNTASAIAVRPRPANTWYGASKAAVVAATRSMALELAQDKIRVCALCPIIADTPLLANALSSYGDRSAQLEAISRMLQQVPLGRLCAAEDMANAALFLASDEASFLTGTCLEVDGGRCI